VTAEYGLGLIRRRSVSERFFYHPGASPFAKCRNGKNKKMHDRNQTTNRYFKLIIAFVICLILPILLVRLAINYILFGIALLTPAPWNAEEDAILRKAIWRGQKPRALRFVLWRRESDINARAKKLKLL